MKRILSGVTAALFLLAAISPVAAAPPTQSSNLLSNGGFENSGGSTGAADWLPWWSEEPKPADGSLNYAYRPSWNQESQSTGAASALVYAGNSSLRVINSWDPWYGGVKQVVSAPAGSRVRLTAYGRAWAAMNFWPAPSDVSVPVVMRVGLEPNGSDNQFASSVVWSGSIAPHDVWQTVSVEATVGASGKVTAILSAMYRGYSRLFMASYWDEASLVVVSSPPPTATTAPTVSTSAPGPTATTGVSNPPPPTAAPVAVITSVPSSGSITYIVRRGDTLWGISQRYGVTVNAIMAANRIANANRIYVGQRLVIPGGAVSGNASGSPVPTSVPSSGGTTYLIQRGDTLWRIALKFGVTVPALKAANGLTSDLIYAGQRLIVPGINSSSSSGSSAPAPTAAPTSVPPTAAAPTATPAPTAVPPTATPASVTSSTGAFNSHGIVSTYFYVENASVGAGEKMWFNWDMTNTTDGSIHFTVLAPHSDQGPNKDSWTSFTMTPHWSIVWRDWLAINTPGTYQIYLGVCYGADTNQCLTNNAPWDRLSNNVTVTVH